MYFKKKRDLYLENKCFDFVTKLVAYGRNDVVYSVIKPTKYGFQYHRGKMFGRVNDCRGFVKNLFSFFTKSERRLLWDLLVNDKTIEQTYFKYNVGFAWDIVQRAVNRLDIMLAWYSSRSGQYTDDKGKTYKWKDIPVECFMAEKRVREMKANCLDTIKDIVETGVRFEEVFNWTESYCSNLRDMLWRDFGVRCEVLKNDSR